MTSFAYAAPPRTIQDTGLSPSYLISLVCKIMYESGVLTPQEISNQIKLQKLVCRQLIKEMTEQMLVEAQGLAGADIKSDIRYALTDLGRKWALEAMLVSQYVGPAPVTLDMFETQIREQSISREQIHRSELESAMSHLVLPDGLMSQLGPAANSGRSVLLYGEPGNGKTSLAEALGASFNDTVYFPHALLVGNQIIKFYDETLHTTADMPANAAPLDGRWVACKRPVVMAGGELSLSMLDLSFDLTARFYEAPMHLKALGGIFVLDDFGRQTHSPQEFLNRWIVPLEKGFDIMALHTGKKFTVPFDQLVVFSSNLMPEQLGDGASLRRIYFKIHVPSPTRDDYIQIFRDACSEHGMDWDQSVVEQFFDREYVAKDHVTSGAHPGFLIRHIISACRYLDRPVELNMELLDLASRNIAAAKRSH